MWLRSGVLSALVLAACVGVSVGCTLVPLPAAAQPGPAAQSSVPLSPMSIESVQVLSRYVDSLGRRHGIVIPNLDVMDRQHLGQAFLALTQKLASLPRDQMSAADYQEIGLLTREFEDVFNEFHGKLFMSVVSNQMPAGPETTALPQKLQEWSDRFKALENVKFSGDYTFFPQNDFGRAVRGSMAANQRGRLNVTAKVLEASDKGVLGDGYLFMRLTGATGRFFPRNRYLLSPTNDINDGVASPFNSGVTDVQINNLIINNNNSNSVRPTVSLEQAYYTQDMRFGPTTKGNFKAGLIYFGNMFDNNNYANSEHLQYGNTQFVNSISWRPNFVGPSTVLQFEQSLLRGKAFLRGTGGIISLADRDFFGGWGGNYEMQLGHKFFNKEGNVRVGYWNFNFRGGSKPPFITPPDVSSGTSLLSLLPGGTTNGSQPMGGYLNFDQKIWKNIGLWGRYAFNDKQFGEVFLGGLLSSRNCWSFGAEIPVSLVCKKRPDDVVGVAYGQVAPYTRDGTVTAASPAFVSLDGVPATTLAQVNQNLRVLNPGRFTRNEKCLETYYRFQLNKNVSISPDMQFIWSPGGTGPLSSILVLGSRLTVTF